MELREGEQILKIYHHHPTPFVFDVLKVIGAVFPFYLALFVLQDVLSIAWYIGLHIVLIIIFALIIFYISLIYWLDRLLVTNQRVLYVDYKFLTRKEESDAFLVDISDIHTKEKGVLAFFWIFDYGHIVVETEASKATFTFDYAPNPEGIRKFIRPLIPPHD